MIARDRSTSKLSPLPLSNRLLCRGNSGHTSARVDSAEQGDPTPMPEKRNRGAGDEQQVKNDLDCALSLCVGSVEWMKAMGISVRGPWCLF